MDETTTVFILPIPIILLSAALIGAITIGYTFLKLGRGFSFGALLGAAAGTVGSLIFMLPLNYCTFEAERSFIDIIAGVFLIGVGMATVLLPLRWGLQHLLSKQPQTAAPPSQGLFRGRLTPVLLLSPTLIILALFLYYPLFDTFHLSTLLARLGARRTAFVCVDNFTRLVSDNGYFHTIAITFGISIATVAIGLALALAIATVAFLPLKGARIYRTLLIWPYAISPAVAGVIFLLLFNPTGGIINYVLQNLIGIKVGWLNDPAAAPWAIIAASVWKTIGYNILFYLAGLQNVPKDLIEAASIDGANALQRFRRVVIPLLAPITFFLVITNMTYAFFESFGTIDYLTGGGPVNSTTTMMYRIYQVGIVGNDLGKAAAESIVLFIMVIGLTILQFRTSEGRITYGA